VTPAADWREQLPSYLAGASAAASVASIAASQILLGLSLVALLIAGRRPRWLPIYPALLAWFALTLVSWAASGYTHAGISQIKKFYVYLMVLAVSSAFRSIREIRVLAFAWSAVAALSAAKSLFQFAHKYRAAIHGTTDFYTAYVSDRVTGFMDHWMTFSGEMMMAILILGALVLFSKDRKGVAWLYPAGVLIAIGLAIAFTRSMWMGAAVGGALLLWAKRPVLILAIPVIAGVVLLVNPFQARERVLSIFQPRAELDSNAHRELTRAVGWRMIQAHSLVGVGPEQVGAQFKKYLPPDTPLPLPAGYYGHLHNIYYHYAAERGLPALLALLCFLGKALFDFARGLRTKHRNLETQWVLYAAVSVLIAVLLSGYYEVNLGDSEVLAMFLSVVACGYVALQDQETA
jgi:putative inorganic carbon (hco3(-)) transporter